MGKLKLFIFLCLGSVMNIHAQDQNEIRAVNNYITFVNESVHGLLIAHRLFEIYNQTINKYVDLPEYQLNNYSNADLPDDIFLDPEGWFYQFSNPYNLYDAALRESGFLGINAETLNQHVSELRNSLGVINKKRITIDKLLKNSDLTNLENLQKVYRELESVVKLYDRFYEVYRAIDLHLQSVYLIERRKNSFTKSFFEFYADVKTHTEAVRKEKNLTPQNISALNTKRGTLEKATLADEQQGSKKRILTNSARLISSLKEYSSGKEIPIEYQLYGSHYHYHNVTILNLTNRYGNGFVNEYNNIAQEQGWLKEMEIPHFYKVIYPKKLPKEELNTLDDDQLLALLNKKSPTLASPQPSAIPALEIPKQKEDIPVPQKEESLPSLDYDRGIVVHEEVIIVNADSFDLELFDHLIKDGDMVSIKVNDEWKFKNISLEKESKVITIHIRPGQQNYILVHADNTGYRPPNTIALAYTVNGIRKEITLKTDLENSQMVEIKYQ